MGDMIIEFSSKSIPEAASMREQILSRMESLGYRSSNIEFQISNNGKVNAKLILVKDKKKNRKNP